MAGLVVRDDDTVGRGYVSDTAWSTNHVSTKDTNQLCAVLNFTSFNTLTALAKLKQCANKNEK